MPVPVVYRLVDFWQVPRPEFAGHPAGRSIPGAQFRMSAGVAGGKPPEGTCPKNRKILSVERPIDGPVKRPDRPNVVKIVDVESLQKTGGRILWKS